MPEKRKDSKGRVLKDGESQRANGTYDYRYTDIHKKRRCIYAKSLTELRKKEFSIDIDKDFKPHYEIPGDKKKVVEELKAEAKEAETVWLASESSLRIIFIRR